MDRSCVRVALLAFAVVALRPASAAAQLIDLTGIWTGTLTCQTSNAGTKEKLSFAPALAITQVGNAVGLRLDFGGGVIERYTGLANPDGKKPLTKGEVGVIHCGTDNVAGDGAPSDEIGRLTAATKAAPSIEATLKGKSVFSAPPRIGTCTWKWTRTSGDDPGVPTGCPDV